MTEVRFREMEDIVAEDVRQWRNRDIAGARTSYVLTEEMQDDWYKRVVCDRRSDSRYWAVWAVDTCIGMAGLQHIEWENGTAEISLVIDPAHRGKGCGKAALAELLRIGFQQMRLHTIWGESYECNPSHGFWLKAVARPGWYATRLPARKWWDGMWWDSLWFCCMEG